MKQNLHYMGQRERKLLNFLILSAVVITLQLQLFSLLEKICDSYKFVIEQETSFKWDTRALCGHMSQ